MSDIAFSVLVGNGYDDIIFKTIMLKGDKGNSIASIEKTSTSGKVDTYTIYLTDGTVGGTFTVTNGEDGAPVNIDDTVTALDKTWSSSKLSGMIKSIDDNDVDADKLWSSQKISSLITQTSQIANQPMASFSDGADNVPVSSLIVDIEAYQDGTGDASPTNIRAISGFDTLHLTKCAKNLIVGVLESDGINSSGVIGGSSTNNIVYAPVKAGLNYALTSSETNKVYAYYRNMPAPSSASYDGTRKTTGSSTVYITAEIDGWIAMRVPKTDTQVQIELGTAPTSYEAFNGGIDTIDLTQTIYGGTLNVSTGLLTITSKSTLINELTWTYQSAYNRFRCGDVRNEINPAISNQTILAGLFCSCLKPTPSNSTYAENYGIACDTGGYLFIYDSDYDDYFDMVTAIGNNRILYPLATPVTIQLTATEVRTLLGLNNIIADTGDINELVYFKTGSETIARMIEAYLRGE